jgi:hypothetical protein
MSIRNEYEAKKNIAEDIDLLHKFIQPFRIKMKVEGFYNGQHGAENH